MTRESRVAASLVLRLLQRHHLAGDVGVLLGALTVEGQADLDRAGLLAVLADLVARAGVGDLVAGDDDRAEDVLGRAVRVAGDERLGVVVDEVGERVLLGAVEGGERGREPRG